MFELAKSMNLKIQVVLSFHACGGNVGDSAQIPLPKWVLEVLTCKHWAFSLESANLALPNFDTNFALPTKFKRLSMKGDLNNSRRA